MPPVFHSIPGVALGGCRQHEGAVPCRLIALLVVPAAVLFVIWQADRVTYWRARATVAEAALAVLRTQAGPPKPTGELLIIRGRKWDGMKRVS